MTRMIWFGGLAILAILALGGAGCRDSKLASVWVGDRRMEVDGLKADWNGIDFHYFEDREIYLGIANDAHSLYLLAVSTERPLTMQALTRGFKVRFRPEKGSRTLWLAFPKLSSARFAEWAPADSARGASRTGGKEGAAGPSPREDKRGDPGAGDRRYGARDSAGARMPREPRISDAALQAAIDSLPKQLDLLDRSGADSIRLSSEQAAAFGIEDAMRINEGFLVIEMKVPLARDAGHPEGIGVPANALDPSADKDARLVEMNFKVPEGEMGRRPPGGEGRRPGGRRGPGGGHRLDLAQEYPGEGPEAGEGSEGRERQMVRSDYTNGIDVTVVARLSPPAITSVPVTGQ